MTLTACGPVGYTAIEANQPFERKWSLKSTMRAYKAIRASVAVAALVLAVASAAIDAESPTSTVKIIYTNDTAGYLEPCG